METTRKLATIQKILDIQPIEGADRIVVATILGWKCVIKKDDNFKVGDLCVYVEVDSIMPMLPEFAFLAERKYRIKIAKFKKQISEGLVLPISCLDGKYTGKIEEGIEVTKEMGITLHCTYEEGEIETEAMMHKARNPIDKFMLRFSLYRNIKKHFTESKGWNPLVPHTDETRLAAMWTDLKDVIPTKMWYASSKLDGQSSTFLSYKKYWFTPRHNTMYSRTLKKKSCDGSNWDRIEKKYKIFDILNDYGKNIYLSGEIVGPKIQKNKYKLTDLELYVFTIFDLDLNRHFSLEEMLQFCEKYKLNFVPVIYREHVFPAKVDIDDIVKLSYGKTCIGNNPNQLKEGLVWREMGVHDGRISFKVLNPEFCMKE